jgi:undecaprenyl-diphosphatase
VISFFQAIFLGVLQGITELFPISSLGHSVLVPKLLGWNNLVRSESNSESFYLAFLVGLHCATAIALLIFYRKTWIRIIKAFFNTLRTKKAERPDERLAWLLIVATIPAGLTGVIFEHKLRVLFAKPLAAAIFLTINGLILFAGEYYRKRSYRRAATRHLYDFEYKEAGIIGLAQVSALLAGISRSGITMVAGLVRGLSHEDAAHFSFLLATPIILAAGVYKLPDLFGDLGNGVRGQILAGSLAAGVAAYFSVRFLTRYFQTRTLTPFAVYCLVAGLLMIIKFG